MLEFPCLTPCCQIAALQRYVLEGFEQIATVLRYAIQYEVFLNSDALHCSLVEFDQTVILCDM